MNITTEKWREGLFCYYYLRDIMNEPIPLVIVYLSSVDVHQSSM